MKTRSLTNPNGHQLELPAIFTPTQILPSARAGEWLVRLGKPIVQQDEIGTTEAAKILGLSQRRVIAMCDEGLFVEGKDWNRPGGPRGKYFIRRAAVWARKTGEVV